MRNLEQAAMAMGALESAISSLETASDYLAAVEELLADLGYGEHEPPKALAKALHKAERSLHHALALRASWRREE